MKLTNRICSSQNFSSTDVLHTARVMVASGLAKEQQVAEAVVLSEIQKGDRFVIAYSLEDQNNPLGIVSWKMEGEIRHGLYELYHIATTELAQKKGVGRYLFKCMEEDAAEWYDMRGGKLHKMYLKTHADNPANAFYLKLGLKHEAILQDHFRKGVDENVYSKWYD